MDELEQLDDMQWHQPGYAGAITTVQHPIGLNEQLQFVVETANKKQKKKR